jgi:2-amino-4-hydroxy-6-hydroxymethyldihydropteridine diphosphokinase
MQFLLEIEAQFGRERGLANAPRPLDLDLIAYGDLVEAGPDLILPHPRAADRRFVMGPLAEIAPDWVHPVLGQSAQALFEQASIGLDAEPIARKA